MDYTSTERLTSFIVIRRKRIICTLIKKKTKFSSYMYKEIQMGSGAESYMRKGFLICDEMRKYFTIYEEAVSHI